MRYFLIHDSKEANMFFKNLIFESAFIVFDWLLATLVKTITFHRKRNE